MSRPISLVLAVISMSTTLACSAGVSPTVPGTPDPVIAQAVRADSEGATLLAGFRVAIDPDTLVATVTPHRTGSAQPPQGQRYDLDIANFQNADSFRVTGVQVLGSGNFLISFSHAHPFPAPNIANPASGSNRADLGYTGRLLILSTYNPQSFFTNAVRMSAGAVINPDGYIEPGDLLANTGPGLVTAYPYKLLADESQNNRTGVSNGGDPLGSYLSTGGGWQRINLGASGLDWTGFDYVHGGQTVTNQFTLSKEALAASSFALDVALLIQYQDPRGAGGSTFRFPPTVIDPLQFAYRLPYAALDCSRVVPSANVTLGPTVGASTTLEVRVRDWDALADESTDSKVGDETDVTLVQADASGPPEVVLDAPGILSGLRNMGTPGSETGWSDDPLVYSNTLPNQEGATAGTYYACLRVTDPEFDDTARETYHAGVDATTLLPNAARAVPARTWQIVPITIGPDVPDISSVKPTGIIGGIDERITFSAVASNDPTSWSWDFGGGTVPNVSLDQTPLVQLASELGVYEGTVTASNAGGSSKSFAFSFRVLGPQQPSWRNYTLEEFATSTTDFGVPHYLALFDGKPVAILSPNWSNGPMLCALATVPNPESPADWSMHEVVANDGRMPSVFVHNGRLAIAYKRTSTASLMLARALVDVPDGPEDWATHVVFDGAEDEGNESQAIDYDGRIAIVYQNFTLTSVDFALSTNTSPTATSDWTTHEIQNGARHPAITLATGLGGNRPVIAFSGGAGNNSQVLQAKVASPSSIGDWGSVTTFTYSTVPQPNLLVSYPTASGLTGIIHAHVDPVLRQPVVLFTSGVLGLGNVQLASRYMTLEGHLALADLGLCVLNGRTAIVGTTWDSNFVMYRATRPDPNNVDWVQSTISADPGLVNSLSLIPVDNAFMMLVDQTAPSGREYSIRYSTGPW